MNDHVLTDDPAEEEVQSAATIESGPQESTSPDHCGIDVAEGSLAEGQAPIPTGEVSSDDGTGEVVKTVLEHAGSSATPDNIPQASSDPSPDTPRDVVGSSPSGGGRTWYPVTTVLARLSGIPHRIANQPHDLVTQMPDTAIEWVDLDELIIRGVSVRGHGHRYEGTVRQDQLAIGMVNDSLVCAVADGVGDSPTSHLGATLASRFTVSWPRAANLLDETPASSLDCKEIADLLRNNCEQRDLPHDSVSTTLTFAAIDPIETRSGAWRSVIVQIGDSPCFLLRDGAWQVLHAGTWHPISAKDNDSTYATSATQALPYNAVGVATSVLLNRGDVLALASDGVGNLLVDESEYAASLAGVWHEKAPTPADLLQAIDAEMSTYDDDRTLLGIRFGYADGPASL